MSSEAKGKPGKRINVYVPHDLAKKLERTTSSQINISAVCQRALNEALDALGTK